MLRSTLFLVLTLVVLVSAESKEDSNSVEDSDDTDGVPVDPNANRKKHRFLNCGFKTAVDLTNNQNLMNVQRLANNVVLAMNRNWNGFNSFALVNIINAVSSGGNCYDITFTIGQTICQNNRVSGSLYMTLKIEENIMHIRKIMGCVVLALKSVLLPNKSERDMGAIF